ncbi:hypothetical protein AB0I28_13020 [Phytomonospora sp. NPDC050363]
MKLLSQLDDESPQAGEEWWIVCSTCLGRFGRACCSRPVAGDVISPAG